MEKKLMALKDARIEVICGSGLVFSGILKAVDDDLIEIADDDDVMVVSIDKIIAVRKTVDPTSRPGFIV